MLERLAREGECSVTELAEPHRMSLPAVSKHLKVLELAGLVRRRRLGRRHAVRLAPWPLRQAWGWMEEYRRFLEAGLDRFESFLAKRQADKPEPAAAHEDAC